MGHVINVFAIAINQVASDFKCKQATQGSGKQIELGKFIDASINPCLDFLGFHRWQFECWILLQEMNALLPVHSFGQAFE